LRWASHLLRSSSSELAPTLPAFAIGPKMYFLSISWLALGISHGSCPLWVVIHQKQATGIPSGSGEVYRTGLREDIPL
jgi:hypothetical protein